MTPIERVRQRAAAALKLNVSLHPTAQDLKRAWKQRGFETHPDQCDGDAAGFREVRAAYELLNETTEKAPSAEPSPRVRPTSVQPRRVVSNIGPSLGK